MFFEVFFSSFFRRDSFVCTWLGKWFASLITLRADRLLAVTAGVCKELLWLLFLPSERTAKIRGILLCFQRFFTSFLKLLQTLKREAL